MRKIWFPVILLCLTCEQSPTDPGGPGDSNPYVGTWRYMQTIQVDFTGAGPETTLVYQGPYDTSDAWDPFVAPSSYIITPTQLITTASPESHTCIPAELPSCRLDGSRLVSLDWISNTVVQPETLRMWLEAPDWLVAVDPVLSPEFSSSWVALKRYERARAPEALTYCPDVPFALASCRTYQCDPSAALVVNIYDATPQDTLDPGAYVHSARLEVNGRRVVATPAYQRTAVRCFVLDCDDVFLPRDVPMARCINGYSPFVVQFATESHMWTYEDAPGGSPTTFDSVAVCMQVAGSYHVSLLDGSQDISSTYDAAQSWHEVFREAEQLGSDTAFGTAEGLNIWIQGAQAAGDLSGPFAVDTIRHRWF